MDALSTGIGTSQVTPYVEGLGRRGLKVTVHSFEQSTPSEAVHERLAAVGVQWVPHSFGRAGAAGGLQRVLRASSACRGAEFIHARGDISAASALLASPERWLWDMRSFWREQRMELGQLRPGAAEERVLRLVERRAARGSSAIVTLAHAAIPVLTQRHGPTIEAKAHVIPTCVDLGQFRPTPPPRGSIVALLSGSLNTYYDVPAMLALVNVLRNDVDVRLEVIAPADSAWEPLLSTSDVSRRTAPFRQMPGIVAASHLGLCMCRSDLGISLRGAMPTKIGEFLACGRPVVVSPGLGDMDDIIGRWQCGIVVPDTRPAGLRDAATRLRSLLNDPELAARCRAAAEETFDLEHGLDSLVESYARAFDR
jgi:glycosyltransferase involved in cell wall biosynthesis